MIGIKQVTTNDKARYAFVENVMQTAFPVQERRDTPQQRAYSDTNPLFFNNIVLEDETPVGMISYWDFGDFYYIEHFAIAPALRNGGYGKRVLEKMKELLKEAPIVLEVEAPTDEMSTRRIGFYERSGFVLHEKPYMQPPYRKGDAEVPMFLMSCGALEMENEFERIKATIYNKVYGVTT